MAHNFYHTCAYFTGARYMRTVEMLADQIFAPTGMKPAYSYIMMALEDKHPMSISEIKDELGYDRSSISRMIRVLEKRNLVSLSAAGRATEIDLTPDSANFLVLANQCLHEFGKMSIDVLGADKDKTTEMLTEDNVRLRAELDKRKQD
ncbi:helix-turn-helix domain-containing protein [Lacticaseibacillus pabuli]|uniref:Helix-turn-helix domain-containing protein n=1 Tax=Lacticaseibacillus pabuli TaxID=3025672 RepID=A0ABY7WSR4_9LACO|nr:helix-turn-helix domain-containing protein [Lacticaseibacillus sp. KACC 23028]WDF83220.1 helix-turn-helix domain-containing protein [Lacticaseibacillus sp. KACC 23028]